MINPDSQRGAETEVIELIANLIASYSHHYELYNSLQVEIKTKSEQWEDAEWEIAESEWHYKLMTELTNERRKAMRVLKEIGANPDEKMHCLAKHSIACYQFSQELLTTDEENETYIELAEYAYQYMYKCISKYLWVEIATCWRCLKDILDEQK